MTINPDNSMTSQAPETDPALAAEVAATLQALSKYIHGKKIYARNNPTLERFKNDFEASFRRFFADRDELVLSIEQDAIRWEEALVYESDKREGSIAFLLYKDGIGELTIRGEIDGAELERFVDIIGEEIYSFASREDVVTRLWKADFEHISYRVLDEYLVGEFGEGNSDGSELTSLESDDHPDLPSLADKGRERLESDHELQSIADHLHDLARRGPGTASDDEEGFQALMNSFFAVSSEELRLVQEEILNENKEGTLSVFLASILDFTLMVDNPSAVRDVSNVIGAVVDYVVQECDPVTLGRVLRVLREFRSAQGLRDGVDSFMGDLERRVTARQVLDHLTEALKDGRSVAAVLEFFAEVGTAAIPRLCDLLEELDGARIHKEICKTLMAIDPGEMPAMIERLDMDKPHVARDVVYLIQASGAREIPDLIRELMYYPDTLVRTEVISFLEDIGGDEAARLLARLLEDEDKVVRMKALGAAETLMHPATTNKVGEIVEANDFEDRSVDEREHVLRTLAVVDRERALEKIRHSLEKRSFFSFGKAQAKEDKLIAIRALERIGGPLAEKLVAGLTDDASNLVKSKARRALDVMKGGDES